MAPGQKDRSLYNKHGKITQSHYRSGYKHQEPASGRPLYSSSDYELSLLRDWQLGSYGSDGIGRQRTLGPSYMGTSDWKKSTVTNKPPPDFSEIPHRPRGTNKAMHGSIDAKNSRKNKRPAAKSSMMSGDLLVDSRFLRNLNLEEEEEPRSTVPVKFFNDEWRDQENKRMSQKQETSRTHDAGGTGPSRSGTIMLVHREEGRDKWIEDKVKPGSAWR